MTKKKTIKKKKVVKAKKDETPNLAQQSEHAGLILAACGDDPQVAQFFLLWLGNGRNATKAYKSLHPDVKDESAAVMGSLELRKIKKEMIMEAYGLGYDEYFKQLKEGLKATKLMSINFELHEVDDHKTRRAYHEAQGKILGIEEENRGGNTAIQVNVGKAVSDWVVTD